MGKSKSLLLLLGLCFFANTALAEYRAYLLEVYDHIQQKQWDAKTGFDPQKYITMHGGGNRLTVLTKATWNCWGETSRFTPACDMPAPKEPKFQVGQKVRINLEKHLTQGWEGTVELSLWREDLKANVYGIRFGDRKQLYGSYYEFNLESVAPAEPPAETK